MVRIIVVTDSGCEDAAAIEIQRWLDAVPTKERNIVIVEGTIEDAALLGYRLQTARRVLIEIIPCCNSLSVLKMQVPDTALLQQLIAQNTTFKVEADILCMALDGTAQESPFLTQELVEEIGGWASKQLFMKANLSRPDVVLYTVAVVEKDNLKIVVGVDVIGTSLPKRDWRIIVGRRGLKSTVAAAAAIYALQNNTRHLLDPLADDGMLVIEAALFVTRTSPRLFQKEFAFQKFPATKDWKKILETKRKKEEITIEGYVNTMRDLKAIRTNAKLAGIEKSIHATKITVDWMDIKKEESVIDCIITAPIPSGRAVTLEQAAKMNDQLFYQVEYVLKKGKTMTCITEKPTELMAPAEKFCFTIIEQRPVLVGKRPMTIVTFKNTKQQ